MLKLFVGAKFNFFSSCTEKSSQKYLKTPFYLLIYLFFKIGSQVPQFKKLHKMPFFVSLAKKTWLLQQRFL